MDPRTLRRYGRATASVTELVVMVVLGVYLGDALDSRLRTAPWLLLGCTTAALTVGMVRLTLAMRGLADPDDPLPPHDHPPERGPAGADRGANRGFPCK
jgi:F0F1-type ATP synthase assembly protein I